MSDYHLGKFDVANMKDNRIILLIGARGTGKTTLLFDLMYHMRDKWDWGLAMTPTMSTLEEFRDILPPCSVVKNMQKERIEELVEEAKDIKERGKTRKLFVILDDCMFDRKSLEGTAMREIFMNGRHFNCAFVNSVQYLVDMKPALRTQVDYVFALRETNAETRKKLWKFFFGIFSSYQSFSAVFDAATNGHRCIVLDRTIATNKPEECIFYYQANPNPPPFRMCRPVYWRLDRFVERNADDIRRVQRGGAAPAPVKTYDGGAIGVVHVAVEDDEPFTLDKPPPAPRKPPAPPRPPPVPPRSHHRGGSARSEHSHPQPAHYNAEPVSVTRHPRR
jgi:hypothetical protein